MNFGIVGCGTIAEFYASAIKNIEGSRISDVFDVNPQSGEWFAKQQGATYHSTYESLLRSQVDAVCICTPSGLHADQVVKASEAGKHVVVEKPIGITLEQLDKISEACKRTAPNSVPFLSSIFRTACKKSNGAWTRDGWEN